MYAQIFVLVLIGVIAGEDAPQVEGPQVEVAQGILRGKLATSRKGRPYHSFTGIPYAEPPVGELRFQVPSPAKPWEGVLDATKDHEVCPQKNPFTVHFAMQGSEDCLFLNVYTPKLPSEDKADTPLPVIFYIHGGAFIMGSGGVGWYGPEIVMDRDVVLVTFNYRLGALGFLSTGDRVVPGNNGLKDQNLALKWVKDNIIAFGGNPEKIAVVGHSAGGASAHYHLLSPLSRDLISGVIAQSGTALAAWALSENKESLNNTRKLAKLLYCETSSSVHMIECLRKIDVEEIIKQDVQYRKWALDPMIPFKPVVEPPNVEGAFLPKAPRDIIIAGESAKVPFVTGITTAEGAIKSSGYYGNPEWINDINERFNELLPMILNYGTWRDKEYLSKKIRKFYFGKANVDATTKNELTKLFTDIIFLLGAEESVRLHGQYTEHPVYYYLFGYRGSASYSKIFGDPEHDYGVCHADELLHIFKLGNEFPDFTPNEADEKMSEVLTSIWENFAATGDPTPASSAEKWEAVTSSEMEYFSIRGHDNIKMAKQLYQDRVAFLKSLGLYSKEPLVLSRKDKTEL